MKDKFTPTNNDLSYYPLLYKALEETTGDVLELGTGYGSTLLLHDYCENKRNLHSFDEKSEWLSKFIDLKTRLLKSPYHDLNLIKDWRTIIKEHPKAKVIFIDHAPGEDRKQMILDFKDTKGILVIHDTEPAADHGYQMRQHFPLFKYKVEVKTSGAWATALSNEIDITKWIGETFGEYTIS
jgi:hypothetical protein